MKQLLETSELKTRVCHRLIIKMNSRNYVSCKQPQYASLLNTVIIFELILLYLTKCFCKHEIFLEYIVAIMKVLVMKVLISSIIVSWYQIFIYVIISIIAQEGYIHILYDVCMQCLVKENFWQLQTIFDSYILFMGAIYYFRQLYTTSGGYILLWMAICYFRRLYTTFSFTWLWFYKNPRLYYKFSHLWIKS